MKAKQEQKAAELAAAGACRQSGQPPPAAGRSTSSSFPLQVLKQLRRGFRADDFLFDKILPRRDTQARFTRAAPRERSMNLPAVIGVNTSHLPNSGSPPLGSPAGRISPQSLYIPPACLPTVQMSRGTERLGANGTFGYLRAPWERQKASCSPHVALINTWVRMTKTRFPARTQDQYVSLERPQALLEPPVPPVATSRNGGSCKARL